MGTFLGCLIVILIVGAALALDWGITVGLVYLICLCFGLSWSMLMATGVWLVLLLVRSGSKVVVNKRVKE